MMTVQNRKQRWQLFCTSKKKLISLSPVSRTKPSVWCRIMTTHSPLVWPFIPDCFHAQLVITIHVRPGSAPVVPRTWLLNHRISQIYMTEVHFIKRVAVFRVSYLRLFSLRWTLSLGVIKLIVRRLNSLMLSSAWLCSVGDIFCPKMAKESPAPNLPLCLWLARPWYFYLDPNHA